MKKKVVSFIILILIMMLTMNVYADDQSSAIIAYNKIKTLTEEKVNKMGAEELAEMRTKAETVLHYCDNTNEEKISIAVGSSSLPAGEYRISNMKAKAVEVKGWINNQDNQLRAQGQDTIDKIKNTEKNKQNREITMPTWDDMKQQADNFASQDKNYITNNNLSTILMPIARMLVAFGSVVLVVVTIVMGIRYMTANPDDQAKLKQQLIGLVIATIIVLGAQGIWALVYNFMIEVTK